MAEPELRSRSLISKTWTLPLSLLLPLSPLLPLPLFLSLCFPLQFIHPHTGKSNSQPPLCWPSKSALALPSSSDLTPNHLPNTEHYSPATLLNYSAPFCTFSTHSLRSCSVLAAAAGSVSETESDDPRDSRARKIDKDKGPSTSSFSASSLPGIYG